MVSSLQGLLQHMTQVLQQYQSYMFLEVRGGARGAEALVLVLVPTLRRHRLTTTRHCPS